MAGDDAQDVALLHDEKILPVDLDLRARPFALQTGHLVLYQTVSVELIGTLINAKGPVWA